MDRRFDPPRGGGAGGLARFDRPLPPLLRHRRGGGGAGPRGRAGRGTGPALRHARRGTGPFRASLQLPEARRDQHDRRSGTAYGRGDRQREELRPEVAGRGKREARRPRPETAGERVRGRAYDGMGSQGAETGSRHGGAHRALPAIGGVADPACPHRDHGGQSEGDQEDRRRADRAGRAGRPAGAAAGRPPAHRPASPEASLRRDRSPVPGGTGRLHAGDQDQAAPRGQRADGPGPAGFPLNPLIQVQDLTYVYNPGTPQAVTALDGVSLHLARGEYVAVVGANGSGKSTLAKCLNALLVPTSGQVLVDGLDTRDQHTVWQVRQRVGMVFQNPDNQLVATVVEEDVAFGPENLGLPPAEIRRRVEEALRVVEMGEYRHHAPHLLSGGQKQRVAIAGILAMRPMCLILDEAPAMLDPPGRGGGGRGGGGPR